MNIVRFGVVGLGWFGEKYVQVLSKLPHVELVAVCSRRLERAKEVAHRYGVRKYYTDWNDIAKDPEIDALGVVTHVPEHKEPVIAAAEAGKHVIVEKPIAGSLEDADEMISATRRNNVHFMVGHILRFETRYAQAKQLIQEGRIGKILSIYARRNIPGSFARPHLRYGSPILLDAIHDTDIMLWYLKDDVESVYATWVQVTDAPNPEITWALYNFSGGARGVCETVWFLRTNTPFSIDARMEVIGTEGAIYIDCANSGLMINDENGTKNLDTMHWPLMHGEIVGALKEELSYFARCVMVDEEPKVVTPMEAKKALEIVLAAEEAARKKQTISLK